MTTKTVNPITDHGDGTGSYRASNGQVWELRKVYDHPHAPGEPVWIAYLPGEYQEFLPPSFSLDKSDEALRRQFGERSKFARFVEETKNKLSIGACIEIYTDELERRRSEGNPDENLVRIARPEVLS